MRFGITVAGDAQIRGRLAALAQNVANLHPALLRASIVPLAAAQGRIRADGPGWPPTVETSIGSPLYRTGSLFRSFTLGGAGNFQEDISGGVRVGSNLTTPDGRYSIARLQQYGTGPIRPKTKKFLVFTVNGQKIFSRGTRGIPKRPILYWDDQTARQAVGIIATYLKEGLA